MGVSEGRRRERRLPASSSRAHFGIMKSLAVGLTWPRIKFTSFQGWQGSVEFLPLIFPLPRPLRWKRALARYFLISGKYLVPRKLAY